MTQTDLFGEAPPFVMIRRDRKSDPASSHAAADEIAETAENQCARILKAVRAHPDRTTQELHAATRISVHTLGRRLPELRTKGLVSNPWYGEGVNAMRLRRCEVGNRLALTWRAV
jgi:DNA-binding HxlR family transcriptional regulator